MAVGFGSINRESRAQRIATGAMLRASRLIIVRICCIAGVSPVSLASALAPVGLGAAGLSADVTDSRTAERTSMRS
jgi:hypothetical protein